MDSVMVRMKIAICVSRITEGGAERVAALWSQGFAQRGYDVFLVLDRFDEGDRYPIPENARIYNINMARHYGFLGKVERRIGKWIRLEERRLAKILLMEKPDVVLCVMPPWSDIAIRARKIAGIKCPVIATDHNSYERPPIEPMSEFNKLYKFTRYKRADYVTVLTKADYDIAKDFTPNASVLPNPLAFEPVEEIPPKEKVILAAGRIDAYIYKGFDILIEAWAKVANKFPDWELHIAGGGSEEGIDRLKKLAERLGLSSRQFKLSGRSENMIELYRKAAIFVLSSRYEGFGLVLIEAMSQGCACIACDYKGRQSEIITSADEGMTIPVEDPDAIAAAISKVIDDDEYRMNVQRHGISRSKYYSIERTIERWDEIFRKLGIGIQ